MRLRSLVCELRTLNQDKTVRQFTPSQARVVGDRIGVNWDEIDLEEFRVGLAVELEHGGVDPQTNVTDDDLDLTGKIAWAHLKEVPDYYTKLVAVEPDIQALRIALSKGRPVANTFPSAAPGWTRKG